jgi:hypothetical protein
MTSDPSIPSGRLHLTSLRRLTLFAGVFAGVALGLRVWYAWGTVSLDEGVYLTVTQRFLQGGILYVSVPESKPPLFFLLNVPATVILHGNLRYASVVVGVLCAIVALIAAESTLILWGSTRAAWATGLVFAIFSSFPAFQAYFILTEPYMVLLVALSLLLILRFWRGLTRISGGSVLGLGVLLGAVPWVRQAGAISAGLLIILFLILLRPQGRVIRRLPALVLGLLLPALVVFSLYYANGYLGDLAQNIFVTPVSSIQGSGGASLGLRWGYFSDVMLSVLPLLFLFALSAIPAWRSPTRAYRWVFVLFSVWLVLVALANLFTSLTGGFQHEYFEILLPLSLMAGVTIDSLVSGLRSSLPEAESRPEHSPSPRTPTFSAGTRSVLRRRRALAPILAGLVVLSAVSGGWYVSESLAIHGSSDAGLVDSLAGFITASTPRGQPTYVYETQWPEIAMSVYYAANRYPPVQDEFYFPPSMTANESSQLIQALNDTDTSVVVLIGTQPDYAPAASVYDYITLNYHTTRDFGFWQPYPWLAPQPVLGMARDSPNQAQALEALNLTAVAPPSGSRANVSGSDTGYAVQFSLQTNDWFTLVFEGFPCNESGDGTSLQIDWTSVPEIDQLQFDFVVNASSYVRVLVDPWGDAGVRGFIGTPGCISPVSSWKSINVSYVGQEHSVGSDLISIDLVTLS